MNFRSHILKKLFAFSLPFFSSQEPTTQYQIKNQNAFIACYPSELSAKPQNYEHFWDYFIIQNPYLDPLTDRIEEYKQQQPTLKMQEAQAIIGIAIRGEPTPSDLEEIIRIYKKETKNRPSLPPLKELGIDTLIILPQTEKQHVDYLGLAPFDAREIRLMSSNIELYGIFVHEITHYEINDKEKKNPHFFNAWDQIAGPYDHVILEEKRGVISVKSYKDGTTGAKYGYVMEYGGKDRKEDIATYTQLIASKSPVFSQITDSFPVYYQKLDFLHRHGFISTKDYTHTTATLKKRQQEIQIANQKQKTDQNVNPSQQLCQLTIYEPQICATE